MATVAASFRNHLLRKVPIPLISISTQSPGLMLRGIPSVGIVRWSNVDVAQKLAFNQ
jgi:hypothetical protein